MLNLLILFHSHTISIQFYNIVHSHNYNTICKLTFFKILITTTMTLPLFSCICV